MQMYQRQGRMFEDDERDLVQEPAMLSAAILDEALQYRIGLGLIDGVGPVLAKKLVAWCGSVEAVFRESPRHLTKIPGIGRAIASSIQKSEVMHRAATEIRFIEDHAIRPIFYLDHDYPRRLTHCEDGPLMLYCQGNMNLNVQRVVSIVGTRKASEYGLSQCEKLVEGLVNRGVLVVSGLAYGVDICAHRSTLKNAGATVGVLAHGLDTIYPALHRKTAKAMMDQGGLITENISGVAPDRENFPKRNRIVAGLADAVVVVESGLKGGSMITANLANDYHRDVFAFPGQIGSKASEGCNRLIKTHRAQLIDSVEDLDYFLGWDRPAVPQKPKPKTFVNLTEGEQGVAHFLQNNGAQTLDQLSLHLGMSQGKLSALLLSLEFKSVIAVSPGKTYQLTSSGKFS